MFMIKQTRFFLFSWTVLIPNDPECQGQMTPWMYNLDYTIQILHRYVLGWSAVLGLSLGQGLSLKCQRPRTPLIVYII